MSFFRHNKAPNGGSQFMPVNITDDTKHGKNCTVSVIQKYISLFILCQIILGAIHCSLWCLHTYKIKKSSGLPSV